MSACEEFTLSVRMTEPTCTSELPDGRRLRGAVWEALPFP